MASDQEEDASKTEFLYKPQKIPCFRQTFLYGIGGELLENAWKTTDVAVFGAAVFSTVSWIVCRYEYRSYREQLRKSFELDKEKMQFDRHNTSNTDSLDGNSER
eukprot:jgi/Galph1/3518/GphlegSOOS_G2152.1